MPAPKLTNEIISAAILGFEGQKKQIDDQIAELRAMLSGVPAETAATPEDGAPGKRRKFSASSRRKMAAAQKARWAKLKGEVPAPEETASTPATTKRRKMSASARKAIGEATKARWAAKRAAAQAQGKKASKESMGRAKKASAKTAKPVKRAVKKSAAPPVAEGAV